MRKELTLNILVGTGLKKFKLLIDSLTVLILGVVRTTTGSGDFAASTGALDSAVTDFIAKLVDG